MPGGAGRTGGPSRTGGKEDGVSASIEQLTAVRKCGGGAMKCKVIAVEIFKRRDSRFWQAKIFIAGKLIRVSTRKMIKAAAMEYALLAFRQVSRPQAKGEL